MVHTTAASVARRRSFELQSLCCEPTTLARFACSYTARRSSGVSSAGTNGKLTWLPLFPSDASRCSFEARPRAPKPARRVVHTCPAA